MDALGETMQNTGSEKACVLIVDDDAMVLDTVSAIFEYNGFEVWRCNDSLSALTLLAQCQPDVMLTDIRMPGMSGTDLLLQLKDEGYTFPVIVMTGYADLDSAVDAVKGGAFDFIRKPFNPEHVVQAANRAVRFHRLLALERSYLARLEDEVRIKTAEIERASRLKTEFLNNISHEIRTPINGIVGMSELAKQSENREEMAEYLGYVVSSSMQLLKIVDSLVTLSSIMTGSVVTVCQECDIRDMVSQTVRSIGGTPSHRPVFAVDIASDVPKRLILEPTLIKMALSQLLENECKYAAPGEVTVNITYDRTRSLLELVVRDSGPGMAPEELQRALELFVQGDGSNTREQGGLGIGLNIVDRIAAFLGGNFRLASQQGRGTEATLMVPVQCVV